MKSAFKMHDLIDGESVKRERKSEVHFRPVLSEWSSIYVKMKRFLQVE